MASGISPELDAAQFTADALAKHDQHEQYVKDQVEQSKKDKAKAEREVDKQKNAAEQLLRKTTQATIQKNIKEAEKFEKDLEEAKKKPLILKINKYFSHFPAMAEKFPKLKANASVLELEEILNLIRDELGSVNGINRLHKWLFLATNLVEEWVGDGSHLTFIPEKMGRPNLKGMTHYFSQPEFTQELIPLLQEIDVEYSYLTRSPLPMRIVAAISGLMLTTHARNTLRKDLGGIEKETGSLPDLPPVKLPDDLV